MIAHRAGPYRLRKYWPRNMTTLALGAPPLLNLEACSGKRSPPQPRGVARSGGVVLIAGGANTEISHGGAHEIQISLGPVPMGNLTTLFRRVRRRGARPLPCFGTLRIRGRQRNQPRCRLRLAGRR